MISISYYLDALQAGTKEKIVPSVKILALEVQFGVRSAVKKVPGFLRCFPNLHTLHVQVKYIETIVATSAISQHSHGQKP